MESTAKNKERKVNIALQPVTDLTIETEQLPVINETAMHIVNDEPSTVLTINESKKDETLEAVIHLDNTIREQVMVLQESTDTSEVLSTRKPFIEANTIDITLQEIKDKHIIPVFIKDNEPVISHVDFIETTMEAVTSFYAAEAILKPNIRLSHPIKGRVPEAKNKPANQLLEHEKTLYYERMAFVIEISSVRANVDGNELSLCIGGVKAYNFDNLYNKKGADEHFKIFIGFQNSVCTNMCITTDGYKGDIRVTSLGELKSSLNVMLGCFNASYTLNTLNSLTKYFLREEQFAKLIGRCRMYCHLPKQLQNAIQPFLFGDTMISQVVKDYYSDQSFCKNADGTISLWKLYSLFTGANKSSYIDNFLSREVNAFQFVYALKMALDDKQGNWFLS